MRTTKKQSLQGIEHLVTKAKKVDNNTFKIHYIDGSIAIRLHKTDIVTYFSSPSGLLKYMVLNSGGYYTVTTKRRINKYARNINVYQRNGVWCVKTRIPYDPDLIFENSMIINERGQYIGKFGVDNLNNRFSKYSKIRKNIMDIPENQLTLDEIGMKIKRIKNG